jgi:hypothetical protein
MWGCALFERFEQRVNGLKLGCKNCPTLGSVGEALFQDGIGKTDGTAKLLVGISAAGGVYVGKLIKIPIAKDHVLVAEITAQPKALDEPWEAIQV